MSLTILRSVSGKLATKRHIRTSGAISTDAYGLEKWFQAEVDPIPDFDAMVSRLDRGLDDLTAFAVRGSLKVGIDLSRPIPRMSNGPEATIEDVPSRILHLDIDGIDEAHLDVVTSLLCPQSRVKTSKIVDASGHRQIEW